MNTNKTASIYFISKLFASVLGFVATVIFARYLGADQYGIYVLVLGVVSWAAMFGSIGIKYATTKRLSEGNDEAKFAGAGFLLTIVALTIVLSSIYLLSNWFNNYFNAEVTHFVLLIVLVTVFYEMVGSLLKGQDTVHYYAISYSSEKIFRYILQSIVVIAGLGLVGLLYGHIVSIFIFIFISYYFYNYTICVPQIDHIKSIVNYAKYAWLNAVQSRTFSYLDVLVLGIFVSASYIGIYQISWQISSLLVIVSSAYTSSVFPKISKMSEQNRKEEIRNLLQESLTNSTLLIIPGIIGSIIIGEQILAIYGEEFQIGYIILVLLMLSRYFYTYQSQFINCLNAIDRPDLAFRVNIIFTSSNIFLNVFLIYLYGWYGAAIATVLSAIISLIVSYYFISLEVQFKIAIRPIGKQWLSALIMGVVTYSTIMFISYDNYLMVVIVAVIIASMIYFSTLWLISNNFRSFVHDVAYS